MVGHRMKIAFIENDTKRRVSFNKRANSLVKNTNELSVLCGVDCCAVIINPFGGRPVVSPSMPQEMERVLSNYTNLPKCEKDLNRFNQEGFTREMLTKLQNRSYRRHRRKEVSDMVCQCLTGHETVDKFSKKDLLEMNKVIEAKLKDIDKRLEFALDQPVCPEPTQGNGKEVIVIPNTPDQNEMTMAEPTDPGKGKEVMKALPFDLNRVKTEEEDPDIAGTWWEDPFQFPPVINNGDGAGPFCSHL